MPFQITVWMYQSGVITDNLRVPDMFDQLTHQGVDNTQNTTTLTFYPKISSTTTVAF